MLRPILVLCWWIGCVAQADPTNVSNHVIKPSDTIPEFLAKYNIPVEEHWVTTDDGYILKVFRLARPGAPVLLLQHGLLATAWCWLVNSPSIAPGIQLYHEGYDIWLTNNRGNTFGKNHTTLNPKHDKQFWNFTFMEMGQFDTPANIKYILQNTGKKDLTFVGWSQGVIQFLVAMADAKIKAYVDKSVNLFVGIAPVSWMKHQKSELFTGITKFHLDGLLDTVWPYGFLEEGGGVDSTAQLFCKITFGKICKLVKGIFAGFSKLDSPGAITNLTAHFPGGCSSKDLRHFAQLIRSGQFDYFDYGPKGNIKEYGQKTPPPILTGKGEKTVSVPTALFIGSKDDLADVQDVPTLVQHIDPSKLVYKRVFADFSHTSYFTGTPAAFQTWYPDLQGLLRKYSPVQSLVTIV